MLLRMLKKDFARGRVTNSTLLLFILLSAMLTATALSLVAELAGAVDVFFTKANAPHFVQMHAGEIDQTAIDDFVDEQPIVVEQQTVEMLNIAGAYLYLGGSDSEAASVMENAFVTQNDRFDFLLDLNNQIIQLEPGQVAAPIYHMQQNDLHIGDTVRVAQGDVELELRIAAFVRDVQMNPSLVSSKRFVVHQKDWETLRVVGESEFLIEFLLADKDHAGDFEQAYQESGLPQTGTAITWSLYRLLSALTDGLVIGVVLLIALLLTAISFLCLRFTILATLEGDHREIGVMKAIGMPMKSIRSIYMVKYTALSGIACILGLLLSTPLSRALSANITLYMGKAERSALHVFLPVVGVGIVFCLVRGFCLWMLRKFRLITAVDALRAGSVALGKSRCNRLPLSANRFFSTNVYLGVQDVCRLPRQYGVLCVVFVLCSFLMTLPLNLYTTMASPQFIAYMGAGISDIRIDLADTDAVETEFERLLAYTQQDLSLARHAAFVTVSYQAEDVEGTRVSIKTEIGDFSAFPLEYLEGAAPRTETQIALSVLQAQELDKRTGDETTLYVDGEERILTVSGIYQDVTNGGKTAKALLPWNYGDVLWYVVNLDVAQGISVEDTIEEYKALFPTARVMDMEQYLSQTLGGTVHQLQIVAGLSLFIAIFVAVCITALFFRMLLAKDDREIAIMSSLGFTRSDIAVQYGTRSLFVLLVGVLLGTLTVGTLGQGLVSSFGALIGASSVRFIVHPILAFFVYPVVLFISVTATTLICSKCSHNAHIRNVTE